MSLDSNYVIAPNLQQYFIDKLTGLPLAGGIVTFYKDQARSEKKSIYKLTGSAPDYSYLPLANPITLSSIGTMVDEFGDNLIPYFYPYDDNGEIELYYITVESELNESQFTISAFPNITASSTSESLSTKNYIPNSQFLAYYTTPAGSDPSNLYPAGQITQEITQVAPGGWMYWKTSPVTSVDNVNFYSFGDDVTIPTGSPKNYIRVNCGTTFSSDTKKWLVVKFDDVNKFSNASSPDQLYTLSFTARSNSVATNIDVITYKYYGNGGSSPDYSAITRITLKETWQQIPVTISFGNNLGKTINDGDYLLLGIAFPATFAFDISITDFVLAAGDTVNLDQFPIKTNREFLGESLTPANPDPLGNDLYLPVRLTPNGLEYDHSDIGKIYPCVYATPNIGELSCNGASYYTNEYSTDGIPYSRLQQVIFNSSLALPNYGTGYGFVTSAITAMTSTLNISTNIAAVTANVTDGTAATGFTFAKIVAGNASDYGFYCFNQPTTANQPDTFSSFIQTKIVGACTAPSAGTTGWTIVAARTGSSTLQQLVQIVVGSSGAGLAGKYFEISNTTQEYCVWFTVDGSGTQPAAPHPADLFIRIDLLSTYTRLDIARIITQALAGYSVDSVVTKAASTMTSGQYFTLYNPANTKHAYWYSIDNTGTVPAISGAKIYKISISSTDTAAQVATKTNLAINSTAFGVPDLRGDFIRMWDNGAKEEPRALNRLSWANGPSGDNIGSYELDDFLSHNHEMRFNPVNAGSEICQGDGGSGVPPYTPKNYNVGNEFTYYSGSLETRPVNMNVNAVIKY